MVHGVEDFAVHHFFELLEVDDEAGAGIDFAFYRDFQGVVVAVAVGVVAFAEGAEILLRSELRVVVVVRCGEFGFAREIDHENQLSVASKSLSSLRLAWAVSNFPKTIHRFRGAYYAGISSAFPGNLAALVERFRTQQQI